VVELSQIASRNILPNGLTVLTKEIHHVPIVTFWVWYRVGSRNERPGITGISHWVEHMMFKGTPSLSKGDIFRLVNANGGVLNGFTWLDYTAYFETLPSHRMDLSINIESDRMANSLFEEDEVQSERTVIISEREGSENSPNFLLGEELNAAAFQSHPYGHSVIGWKTDLQRMTRQELFDHYRTFYAPNNAIVVAVGDFQTDALLRQVEASFGQIPAGPPIPRMDTAEPPQRGERRVTVRRPAGVPSIEVGYHSPGVSSPDAFPMMVLDAVLSGGKSMGIFGSGGTRMGRSSRLYRALVDGELASAASSSFALTTDPYLFGIDATLRPGGSLEEVEKAVFQEVERLQQDGVTQEEMTKAVKQVRAQLVFGSDSVTDWGYWLGAMEVIDRHETFGEMLERVEQVTAEEVQRVARQYLTESNRTVGWLIPTDSSANGGSTNGAARPQAFFYSGLPSGERGGEAATGGSIHLDVRREVLENGTIVLTSPNSTSPQVVVRASLVAGSVFDPEGKSGLARIVAPMLMRGTAKRSFQEFNELTDSIGMAISADAGRLTAQASLRCLREDFATGLQALAELLRTPTFPEDELEKYRSQVIASLRQQDTSARTVAERRFLEELYPEGHPLHRWSSGTQASVGDITRDDLLAFYHSYFRPDTLVVAVVGDITHEEALGQVRDAFYEWKCEGPTPSIDIPEVDGTSRHLVEMPIPGKFQSEMVMGLPALPRNHPDYYPLRLGNLILGELGLSGRLGASIREQQGLAYHVSSDVQASIGPSPWAIRAGVNPANVDKAVESALREVERWRSDLVADEELADGKSYLVGSLPIAMESADGVARTLLDIEFYQLGLDFLERYPQIIMGITAEAIRDAVNRWIHPDRLVTVVAGPPREATGV
jgi:zinc protease